MQDSATIFPGGAPRLPDPGAKGSVRRCGALPERRVTILMAVHQGAAHLREQLDSFSCQSHVNWHLIASLEGAEDGSRDILTRHPEAWRTTTIAGPGKGSAANFLHLIRHADASGCWAFSDQDDVWLPQKLARAIRRLEVVGQERPALYHSRHWVTDAGLGNQRISPRRQRPASFGNALVQNVAGGNTIVLNAAAAKLVKAAALGAGDGLPVHDWWLYQVISGAGGEILHDEAPGVLYRQHGRNVLGANRGLRARLHRLRLVLDGTYRRWLEANLAALQATAHLLTPGHQAVLATVVEARRAPMARRVRLLRRAGIYRQGPATDAVMWLSVLFGRF